MRDIIIGVFSGREDVEDAIEELKASGYDPKDISIAMKDTEELRDLSHSTGSNMAEGAVTGATTGGVVGAIAGLLIGVGAIAIPGVGAVLIGGPLAAALGLTGAAATTLSGAATGVLAGGLLGALVGIGLPEEDARVYESRMKEGAILIAVPTRDASESKARDILEENGAERVRTFRLDEKRLRSAHA